MLLYSNVLEVNEHMTLMGYTSDPNVSEHTVKFTEDGKVERGLWGLGWDSEHDAEVTADMYLTPILMEYLDGFFKGFDERLQHGLDKDAKDELEAGMKQGEQQQHDLRVEFMGSNGRLFNLDKFPRLKSILIGPAGSVVGYALTSQDEAQWEPVMVASLGELPLP